MIKSKDEFLKKLAQSEFSLEEMQKGVKQFAGGNIDWIADLVKKHIGKLLEDISMKCEKKKASPSIVLRVLAEIMKMQVEEIENAAAAIAAKELEQVCKVIGLPVQEVLEVMNNKKLEDASYIS